MTESKKHETEKECSVAHAQGDPDQEPAHIRGGSDAESDVSNGNKLRKRERQKKQTKKKRKAEADDQQLEASAKARKDKRGVSGKKKASSAKQSNRPRTARPQKGQGGGARTDRK